jgi:hypothetical protein
MKSDIVGNKTERKKGKIVAAANFLIYESIFRSCRFCVYDCDELQRDDRNGEVYAIA